MRDEIEKKNSIKKSIRKNKKTIKRMRTKCDKIN